MTQSLSRLARRSWRRATVDRLILLGVPSGIPSIKMTSRDLLKRLFPRHRQVADDAANLLQGGIELITPSLIAGWVYHPHHPLCDVLLMAGSHLLAQVRIEQSRPDVEEELEKKGLFGFQLEIPADLPLLRVEAAPLVLAFSAESCLHIPLTYIGSPSTTQKRLLAALAPERRGLRGHFDGLTPDGMHLHGWCYQVGGREPAKVWLQAQDLPPLELICQQPRPGMASQGQVEGCGFSLATADWPEAAGSTISATFDQEGLLYLPQIGPVYFPPREFLYAVLQELDQESPAFAPLETTIECRMDSRMEDPIDVQTSAAHDQSLGLEKPVSDYVSEITVALSDDCLSEAEQCLKEALALYPGNLDLLIVANNLYRVCSDHESALAYAKQIIDHHPSSFDGYCRSAQDLAFHLGRHDEAIETISIGLEKFPDELWTLWTGFLIYSGAGQDDHAQKLGQRLANLHPSFSQIYPLLTTLLLKNKQVVQAEKLVEMAFSNLPADMAVIRLKLELLLGQRKHFAYRNWLYPLTCQFTENLPEFLDYIHRFEVLSRHRQSIQRNGYACDVCCVASDEAPYIAEFIHHYLFLGFSNIYIGINNSSDTTGEIIHKIAAAYPQVHVLDVNHVQSLFQQTGCYRVLFDYARKHSESQYCLFVDVDEFWVADSFPKSIADFLSEKPAFDVYCFHWILALGEAPFMPPLAPPQEYVWNAHVKSICSYDADLIDIRVHAPLISSSDNLLLFRGNSPNTEISFTLSGIDVHQLVFDEELSPIGLPGCGWILHRIFRSEIEYSFRLFKKTANSPDHEIFKSNRSGYFVPPSSPGAHEYLDQVLPPAEVLTYHHSLDTFIETCGVYDDIVESRMLITEEEIYKKLNHLSAEDLLRESATMKSIFSGTRFCDWLQKNIPSV